MKRTFAKETITLTIIITIIIIKHTDEESTIPLFTFISSVLSIDNQHRYSGNQLG